MVTSWLPDGLIPPTFFHEWETSFRSGQVHHRTARALLPEPDRWPLLEPVCSKLHDDPRDVFLHTLDHKAQSLWRAEKATAGQLVFPYGRILDVEDSRTTEKHRGRRASVFFLNAASLAKLTNERVWSCRCDVVGMNDRMLQHRGLEPPRLPT